MLSKHERGLDTQIQPMGEGLSNGEKQAICCLRGLLRKLSQTTTSTVAQSLMRPEKDVLRRCSWPDVSLIPGELVKSRIEKKN